MQRPTFRVGSRWLAALLCVLVLAGPVAAQGSVSEEYELALGRAVAAELAAQYGLVTDHEWVAFLSNIRDRLLPFSRRPRIPYHVMILDTATPNAFATPGYVFVTRGMLRIGLDVEGWAFVIGHEMAHSAKRHIATQIERAQAGQLFAIFVAVFTGSRAILDLANLLLDLAFLGFSREVETDADIEALRMMVEAGFDPAKAAATLTWFNEATGRSNERTHWAGTHPGWLDRAAAVGTAYAGFSAKGLPQRVWYLRERVETAGIVLTAGRMAELLDSWSVSVVVENAGDVAATIAAGQVVLHSPDGELPIRFLRSTLPGEVAPGSRISGDLLFEKRSSTPPTALVLPVLFQNAQVDLRLSLTMGGPITPEPTPAVLPKPPALP